MIERELKLRLPDEAAWARLREALGPVERRVHQENVYFDTPDRRLLRSGALMVRVRVTDQGIEVTAKDRVHADADQGTLESRERSCPLAPEAWAQVHRQVCALNELDVPLCRTLGEEAGGRLLPIGSLVNTREVVPLPDGYVAELDRTELPGGRCDFEVEVELRGGQQTFAGARRAVQPALDAAGIPDPEPASPKYRRFLEAVAALGDDASDDGWAVEDPP